MNGSPIYRNYIGGKWVDSISNETFENRNPADGSSVAVIQKSGVEDVKMAVAAARTAFEETNWKDEPRTRAAALHKFADALRENEERIAYQLTIENGKPLSVSRFEVQKSIDTFDYYAGLARNIYGHSMNFGSRSLSIWLREPWGVVGLIVPWNGPLALLSKCIAPALAAGNSVVVKPASLTSASTAEFVKLFDHLPEIQAGIVNMVTGPGVPVGEELSRNEDVDMINFTGETATGKRIMQLASSNVKKVWFELGGKSPNIILDDSNIERAIKGAVTGAQLGSSGQACFAGTRVLVQDDIHDKLVSAIKQIIPRMKVGRGTDPSSEIGPVISGRQLKRVLEYVEIGKKEGKLIMGGERAEKGELAKGFFVEPTVFDQVPIDARIAQEEIFGPVISVMKFHTIREAVEIANNTVYGLAAAVWTNSLDKAMTISRALRAGTVWVNTYSNMHTEARLGGYKQSGVGGSITGIEGLYEYTRSKHINFELELA